jgi:energy-coupling factor transporter transmembrane protein EcfT
MAVELRPSKRPPSDYYFQDDFLKKWDLAIGFVIAAIFWYATFYPHWYAGPIAIVIVSLILIRIDIRRRYIAYGALLLLMMPLILWSGGGVFRFNMVGRVS